MKQGLPFRNVVDSPVQPSDMDRSGVNNVGADYENPDDAWKAYAKKRLVQD